MKKYDEEKIVNNNEYNSVIINARLSHEQVWIRHSPQSSQDIAVASIYNLTDNIILYILIVFT